MQKYFLIAGLSGGVSIVAGLMVALTHGMFSIPFKDQKPVSLQPELTHAERFQNSARDSLLTTSAEPRLGFDPAPAKQPLFTSPPPATKEVLTEEAAPQIRPEKSDMKIVSLPDPSKDGMISPASPPLPKGTLGKKNSNPLPEPSPEDKNATRIAPPKPAQSHSFAPQNVQPTPPIEYAYKPTPNDTPIARPLIYQQDKSMKQGFYESARSHVMIGVFR